MEVGVVGEGDRFRALLDLLAHAEHDVHLWQPDGVDELPEGYEAVDAQKLRSIPLIFIALPMTRLRAVARALGDVLTARHGVVHLCHNLEHATLKTASTILDEETPTHRFAFVTGPMRAEDVEKGLPSAAVCASRFPELHDLVEESLVSPRFRLYRIDDLPGAEVAAAYGRVIAMASGVAHEMGLGRSIQATLFARGLAETARVVVYRGGYERTTFGLAGAGNVYLDTSSPGSDDFMLGAAACKAGAIDRDTLSDRFGSAGRDLMGLIESLWSGLRGSGIDLHILEACHMMVSGDHAPREAVAHLMSLPTLSE